MNDVSICSKKKRTVQVKNGAPRVSQCRAFALDDISIYTYLSIFTMQRYEERDRMAIPQNRYFMVSSTPSTLPCRMLRTVEVPV